VEVIDDAVVDGEADSHPINSDNKKIPKMSAAKYFIFPPSRLQMIVKDSISILHKTPPTVTLRRTIFEAGKEKRIGNGN
jgi:hypothetical protein